MRGRLERQLYRQALQVAGVDEVGRGCLAGPVYAGAVVLNYKALWRLNAERREQIRDSKMLTGQQRHDTIPLIRKLALDFAVAHAEVHEIEELGIVPATFLAMRRALMQMTVPVDVLLIDGNRPLAGYEGPQQAIVKGDYLCYCIAAASILAKEARDAFMRSMASEFPAYGFETHVGYGTKKHLAAIAEHGACSLHRRNFAPVRDFSPEP